MANFCLNCGSALVAREIEGRPIPACPSCEFVLWPDPKVVTMTVVEDQEGRLVLGRRAIEPGYGLWCLPGGYVNDDEHPLNAAVRECREEILSEVAITGLLDVYHIPSRHGRSMVALAYLGQLVGPGYEAGPEMLEVRAFAPGSIPPLAFESHLRALSDWRERKAKGGVSGL